MKDDVGAGVNFGFSWGRGSAVVRSYRAQSFFVFFDAVRVVFLTRRSRDRAASHQGKQQLSTVRAGSVITGIIFGEDCQGGSVGGDQDQVVYVRKGGVGTKCQEDERVYSNKGVGGVVLSGGVLKGVGGHKGWAVRKGNAQRTAGE